jgi:uncharacterized membrane protein YecN with MAPEG domain
MTFPITTLYALPLIAIWMTLFMRVSGARSTLNCSFGDAGDMTLLRKVRQHGNFIEWVPLTLLLMVLAEAQGTDALWLYGAGTLLLIGRIAHPFGLVPQTAGHPLRYVGNGTNILAVLILAVALIRIVFGF